DFLRCMATSWSAKALKRSSSSGSITSRHSVLGGFMEADGSKERARAAAPLHESWAKSAESVAAEDSVNVGAWRSDVYAMGSVRYGLVGVTAGVQYPARVTPFLEGRFVGGVLEGQLDGALTVGETTYRGNSATTWIYGGGLETGVEVYLLRRLYLSAALGWM